jgi:GNAT superfamily N-acetyltransferase
MGGMANESPRPEEVERLVRHAVADDAPFLQSMIWEALLASPNLFGELGSEGIQRREERYWRDWTPDAAPAFVAHDATGGATGALVLYKDGAGEGRSWRIGLAVVREARRQGVGEALLRHALAHALAQGGKELRLFVDRDNGRAIRLYRKVGFEELGETSSTIEMRLALG